MTIQNFWRGQKLQVFLEMQLLRMVSMIFLEACLGALLMQKPFQWLIHSRVMQTIVMVFNWTQS